MTRGDAMTEIALQAADHPQADTLLAQRGALTVTAFTYPTGVAGLRIANAVGHIDVLPFQGQQIWDAVFRGRRLTMETAIPHPLPTRDYRATYGAFFLHCGGSAMGNPTPADTHPLHGELPNLPMDSAVLRLGSDAAGDWAEVESRAVTNADDGGRLDVVATVRLHAGATLMEIGIAVGNAGSAPQPFFYLGHANFAPLGGATIIDDPHPAAVTLRPPVLSDASPAAGRAWHDAVATDYARHRDIRPDDCVDPEFVATYRIIAPEGALAETRQVHPDGCCDVVRQQLDSLPAIVRWIDRSTVRRAVGFALPATTSPDGRAAALAADEALWLEPGARFQTTIWCGSDDRT